MYLEKFLEFMIFKFIYLVIIRKRKFVLKDIKIIYNVI